MCAQMQPCEAETSLKNGIFIYPFSSSGSLWTKSRIILQRSLTIFSNLLLKAKTATSEKKKDQTQLQFKTKFKLN